MYTKQLHTEPTQNVLLAHHIRLKVPDTEVLAALTLEEANEIANSSNWLINGSISIKKVPGVTISQFAWLDGKLSNNITAILNNRLLSGDQGETLDANIMTMWAGRIKMLDNNFKALRDIINEKEPGFKGFVGMTVSLSDKPYYCRIFTRVPYDFVVTFGELMGRPIDVGNIDELHDFIKDLKPGMRYACSMRVYHYPYDRTLNLALEVPEGKIGVDSWIVTGTGEQVAMCWENAFSKVDDLVDVCYRIDGYKIARNIINDLRKGKYQ